MYGSLEMAVSSLCLFFMFTPLLVALLTRASQDVCTQLQLCGDSRLEIRFPFRLRDRQPINCGYPGFDLTCIENDTVVLELPSVPFKLGVQEIRYDDQQVFIDPDTHIWFQRKPSLELLNLSGSPFRFNYGFSGFTLLNCSRNSPSRSDYEVQTVQCSGSDSPSYDICAISSTSCVEDDSNFIDCTKMYDYYAPVGPYSTAINPLGPFSLTWSKPNCTICEQQLEGCRLKKNGTEHETECFKTLKDDSVKAVVTAGSTMVLFVILLMVIAAIYGYTSDKKRRENHLRIEKFLEDYAALKPSRYVYAEIKKITDQFSNELGQGAYGTVFKGKISNDILVAVKILNKTKGNGEEFINEVATMGKIHHVNVVRLVGYCADGFRRALVYEFLPNGSLDKYISKEARSTDYSLSWDKLHDIALGIAKGIEYLHQGCNQRILHFDIKPHNILLDQNFSPRISDFGLAKLCSKDQSIVSMSTARGTLGYIAPEVFSRNFGNVSYKSDVYSFGILLLEMVGGRNNTNGKEENDAQEVYYPEWIYNLLEDGEDLRIQIEGEEDAKIAKKLAVVGLWCIQWHPVGRPTMKAVVQMLEGDEELAMPPNPFASTGPSKTNTKMASRLGPLEAIAE